MTEDSQIVIDWLIDVYARQSDQKVLSRYFPKVNDDVMRRILCRIDSGRTDDGKLLWIVFRELKPPVGQNRKRMVNIVVDITGHKSNRDSEICMYPMRLDEFTNNVLAAIDVHPETFKLLYLENV
jgi:hypothetical protein